MYLRKFITLTGAGTGRVVLEGKADAGKATLYLQNMKQGAYRLILLCKEEAKTIAIDVASVITSEKGGFDGKIEFEAHSIAKSGIALEKIDAAAIIHTSQPNNYDNFTAPLTGFVDKEYPWRTNLVFSQEILAAIVDEGDAQKEDAVALAHLQAQNTTIQEPPPPKKEVVSQEKITPAHAVEEAPQPAYETSFEHHHPSPSIKTTTTAQNTKPAPNPQTKQVPVTSADRIERLFNSQNIVSIFKDDQPQTQWITASIFDLHALGLYNYSMKNNPFIVNNARIYKHVLLGKNQEGYSLGVPDVLSTPSQTPPEPNFATFKPCHPDTTNNAHGYWILPLTTLNT